MTLKVVSYNIQAGISTNAYRQYITQSARQLFHTKSKTRTLAAIADFASDYDVACIQEVDLGGRRNGFSCQADALLFRSEFSHISTQENRVVGNISRHGNAILSKHKQSDISDLKLPGKRTGRGAILTKINAPKPFHVLNVHLSLGLADQMQQVDFIANRSSRNVPMIIAGDFNCGASSKPVQMLAERLNLKVLSTPAHKTYPSWNPRKDFDHILVSKHFQSHETTVEDVQQSDHRPLSAILKY